MSDLTREQFETALRRSLDIDNRDAHSMWIEALGLVYRGDNKRETLDECFKSATVVFAFARCDESDFVMSEVLKDCENNPYILVMLRSGQPLEATLHACFVDGKFYVTYPFGEARYERAYWELTAQKMTVAAGGD
jgi:hypothetical protein